ncbi:MAG: nucleotidyltransferase domain-containing protein [Nanoarchaeota archaeon]|nr:nucleotidyltransferase domain-containing protein [Nanoarchaeota archaeon]
MIDIILSNRTNLRIIRFLMKFPNKYFSVKEIGKYTGLKGGNLYLTIRKLKLMGIILDEKDGLRKFKINAQNQIYPRIKEMFSIENSKLQDIEDIELNLISDFVSEVLKRYKDVSSVILFGSVARGFYKPESDIDLLILKDKVNNKIEMEITNIAKGERRLQIHLHTPKEFASNEPLFKEIRKEGIDLLKIFS